jgi:Spy/CpxP family protein refolding chaperone
MTKRLLGYISAVALVISIAVAGAIAQTGQDGTQQQPQKRQGRGPGMGPGFGGGMGIPFGMLNLTDDQKTQIKAIFDAQMASAKPLRDQLKVKEEALHAAETATDFNAQAVRAASQDLAATETELTVLRAQAMHAALAVLTPDQLAKLKEIQSQHRGPRGGGPGGPRNFGGKPGSGNPIQN